MAKLHAGGLFCTFVDVVEKTFERVSVVFEGTDVRGDRFQGANHAFDVASGFEIGNQSLCWTAVTYAENNRFGTLLGNCCKTAFPKDFFGGIPPFFEAGFRNHGAGKFFFQGVAGHAPAVAFKEMNDQLERISFD